MTSTSLNKDKILQHTNAQDIFLTFLQLPEFPKKNIRSPFNEDIKPSFTLYTNGTFKCNSSQKQGDVWQFVADLNGLDCKTQMPEVLKIVVNEMNILNLFDNSTPKKIKVLPKINTKKQTESVPKKLSITPRKFTPLDMAYWTNLGVNEEILNKYDCISIENYSWDASRLFNTKDNSVAFSWTLEGQRKLYIPEQPEISVRKTVLPAFKNGIFGFSQLTEKKHRNIIICEGEKDVVVAASRGFRAVTFGSASIYPKRDMIDALQSKCHDLYVCFDADEAGETGMSTIIANHPEIIPIYLPNTENLKGFDITDYFQNNSATDFQQLMEITPKKESEIEESTDPTIFHKAEIYLSKNYEIRFDVIANEIEIRKINENNWTELNEDQLYVEMQKKHIKISLGNLKSILLSDFVPKFNPVTNYFKNLPAWDGKVDHIKEFASYVTLASGEDPEQFVYQYRKWLVRSVKCSTQKGYHNKQAFILADDAKGQNIGKTTYLRFLVPRSMTKYYCENLPDDKDALKRLGQNILINLDELATLSKTDINGLKSMLSNNETKTRLPYGKKDVIIPRIANFIGSTNMSTFLVDESGSVRWLCFVVEEIDFSYSSNFNIDNLWAQAYFLSKDKNFQAEFTPEDVKMNESRNEKFQVLTPERELIPKYFRSPNSIDKPEFMTATDILNYISLRSSAGVRLNAGAIGRALPKCGFVKSKSKDRYGYWVVQKQPSY